MVIWFPLNFTKKIAVCKEEKAFHFWEYTTQSNTSNHKLKPKMLPCFPTISHFPNSAFWKKKDNEIREAAKKYDTDLLYIREENRVADCLSWPTYSVTIYPLIYRQSVNHKKEMGKLIHSEVNLNPMWCKDHPSGVIYRRPLLDIIFPNLDVGASSAYFSSRIQGICWRQK